MTYERAMTSLMGGVTLLERAISYTLGSLHIVTHPAMANPTPCRDWDLRALLCHMNDSLLALQEAIDVGHVDLDTSCDDNDPVADPVEDPVAALQARACRLLGGWTNADSPHVVSIGSQPLTTGIVTSTGAIEVAVHGWDISRACGLSRSIPSPIAEEMLELSPLFVTAADRPTRFAAPVEVPPWATPGDRLLAFLGRRSY